MVLWFWDALSVAAPKGKSTQSGDEKHLHCASSAERLVALSPQVAQPRSHRRRSTSHGTSPLPSPQLSHVTILDLGNAQGSHALQDLEAILLGRLDMFDDSFSNRITQWMNLALRPQAPKAEELQDTPCIVNCLQCFV